MVLENLKAWLALASLISSQRELQSGQTEVFQVIADLFKATGDSNPIEKTSSKNAA